MTETAWPPQYRHTWVISEERCLSTSRLHFPKPYAHKPFLGNINYSWVKGTFLQILTIRSSPHCIVYRQHINSLVTSNLIKSLNLKIKPCKTSIITCRFVSLYVSPSVREVWLFSYTKLYARLSVTTLYLDSYFSSSFLKHVYKIYCIRHFCFSAKGRSTKEGSNRILKE